MVTAEPNLKKNSPKETRAGKLAFIFSRDVTKIRKTRVVSRVGIHLGARSGDAMYRMRESKSFLSSFFLALGLNRFEWSLKLFLLTPK